MSFFRLCFALAAGGVLFSGCAGQGGSLAPVSDPFSGSGAPKAGGGVPASSPTLPMRYTIVDLGANVQPAAINNSNVVVGTSASSNGSPQAFYYSSGSMKVLSARSGDVGASAYDISDSGVIVGASFGSDIFQTPHAVEFQLNGAPTYLGAPSGDDASSATSINSSGKIVGIAYSTGSGCVGTTTADSVAAFDGHGGATDLVTGYNPSVDSSGTIAYSYATDFHGSCGEVNAAVALYPSGTITLPSNALCGNSATATTADINNAGYIVGQYAVGQTGNCGQPAPEQVAGFISYGSSSQEILPAGGSEAQAAAINNERWVVGSYYNRSQAAIHAFLWANGSATDLNLLLPAGCTMVLRSASDVNDRGYVVGIGLVNGQPHGFLLVPQ